MERGRVSKLRRLKIWISAFAFKPKVNFGWWSKMTLRRKNNANNKNWPPNLFFQMKKNVLHRKMNLKIQNLSFLTSPCKMLVRYKGQLIIMDHFWYLDAWAEIPPFYFCCFEFYFRQVGRKFGYEFKFSIPEVQKS